MFGNPCLSVVQSVAKLIVTQAACSEMFFFIFSPYLVWQTGGSWVSTVLVREWGLFWG